MNPDKRYVTQLSRRDLKEIADVANIDAGEGIILNRTEKGIEIAIDKQSLQFWVKTIINGGQIGG